MPAQAAKSVALPTARPAAAVPAVVLALVMPGAGHLYLGRRAKGLIFMGCLLALFALGLLWDARLEDMRLVFGGRWDDPLGQVRALAKMAIGLPYVMASMLGLSNSDPQAVKAVMYEYGNTFAEVGGLLNLLVALDAWDTAVGRKP